MAAEVAEAELASGSRGSRSGPVSQALRKGSLDLKNSSNQGIRVAGALKTALDLRYSAPNSPKPKESWKVGFLSLPPRWAFL